MAVTVEVQRKAGHPWDVRPGFDLLMLDADSEADLDAAVTAAESKFWQPWLIGVSKATGKPGGVMYKPCGAQTPWHDSPEQPHPGGFS